MFDTVKHYLGSMISSNDANAVRRITEPIADRMSTQCLTSAGLVIHGSGSAVAKTGAATTYAVAQGKLQSIAAATDMPALAGTVANATFNVFCFYIDSAGVVTSAIGTAGATLNTVKMPIPPVGKALIGFLIVNPTGTGNFVGGTTALDDGTVVPGTVYVNVLSPIDTSILLC